jgi:hypothetical protein
MAGYSRDDVCEINTNMLSLKKARKILDKEEFFQKMTSY